MKNIRVYDIIIIGAGPAGLACAKELKSSNLSVLLVDRNKEIGPKICAGGLTGLIDNFTISEDKTRSFITQTIVIKNKTHIIRLKKPIRTITRLELGLHQLQQLEDASNITILKETEVKEIKGNQIITTNNKTFDFNYLVGADGSNSLVRKSLGLESKCFVGLYYEIPIITDKCIWYLHQKLLSTGYIWVFPHKEHTNIGVYFNPAKYNAKKAKEVLENYITEKGYSFASSEIKGAPICYNYEGYEFGNIYLAGDAAGLTTKGSGEGLSYALVHGQEIARKIKDVNYKPVELKKMIQIKKRQDKIYYILETFPFLHSFLYTIFIQLMRVKKFQNYFGI